MAQSAVIERRALPNRLLLGIAYMCVAGTIFPVMNGIVQILSPRYSSEQLVWARTITHLLFALLLFGPRHGLALIRTNEPMWQLARSICQLMSTYMYFNGVKYLPLAKAASISFTAPFIVTLLAWPMLRERVSAYRFAAVAVGFLGVLVVIRPGSEMFQWASLLLLGSSTCYAFYQIFTRRVAGHDSPETSMVYSALVGTVVLSAVVPFRWTPILSWQDGGLMIGLGILGGLGHYCIARALTYAPANVIAPFGYWQMVGSIAVGYLISGAWPDASVWVGATIIISAGLYIGWRETRERRRTS